MKVQQNFKRQGLGMFFLCLFHIGNNSRINYINTDLVNYKLKVSECIVIVIHKNLAVYVSMFTQMFRQYYLDDEMSTSNFPTLCKRPSTES